MQGPDSHPDLHHNLGLPWFTGKLLWAWWKCAQCSEHQALHPASYHQTICQYILTLTCLILRWTLVGLKMTPQSWLSNLWLLMSSISTSWTQLKVVTQDWDPHSLVVSPHGNCQFISNLGLREWDSHRSRARELTWMSFIFQALDSEKCCISMLLNYKLMKLMSETIIAVAIDKSYSDLVILALF